MKTKLYTLLVVLVIALSAKGYRVGAEGCDVSAHETESVIKEINYLSVVAQINSDSILSSLFFQRNKTAESKAPVCRWAPGYFRSSSGSCLLKCFDSHSFETESDPALFASDDCFYKFHYIRI